MSDYRELRDALAAATPGPWSKGSDSHWGTEVRGPDNQTVAHCGGIAEQARRNIEYLVAANPQTIAALLDDLDAARAEIARLTTLRPMIELTQADGKVLIHPIRGQEAHATDVSEMRFTAIECGLGEGQAWREHYRGWTPIPEAKP